jgi:hypothetical protein
MSVKIINPIEYVEPYMGEDGYMHQGDSTEALIALEKAIPSKKRKQILQWALDQADIDNPIVFVTAWEALNGKYVIVDEGEVNG